MTLLFCCLLLFGTGSPLLALPFDIEAQLASASSVLTPADAAAHPAEATERRRLVKEEDTTAGHARMLLLLRACEVGALQRLSDAARVHSSRPRPHPPTYPVPPPSR